MGIQVLTGKLTFESKTPPDLSCCTKQELVEYFENSYDLNESLFTALNDESGMYKCPDRLRLPLIFYYTHTAVVYVNKMILAGLLKERIDFEQEEIFETGVDEMSWDDTEHFRMGGSFKWPCLKETVEYRRKVRKAVLSAIQETPLELPINMNSKWWALMMGIEHERIHLETSSVLIRQLPVTMVTRPERWNYAPNDIPAPKENRLIRVDGDEVTFGKPWNFPSYGWDNEYGEINSFVPTFEASEYLVTNQAFLEFIQDGGYKREELWTKEGWRWRVFRDANHPMFWVCQNRCKSGCGAALASYSHCQFSINDNSESGPGVRYRYRAMFDDIDMPWAWPVDVNYHEAKAFCTWKGPDFRLLSEAEHNVIRGKQESPAIGVKADVIFAQKVQFNHNLQYGSSTAVTLYGQNNLGFYDVFGNVWEWSEDQFNGLCTETHALYDDFSSPCYDGKHNVILGGSWISTGDEASRFARYAFRRHFLQHAGFRIAKTVTETTNSAVHVPARIVSTEVFVLGCGVEERKHYLDSAKVTSDLVESTNIQYRLETVDTLRGIIELEFGFRKSFPVMVADLCNSLVNNNRLSTQSCLWLGAGCGRGPFEMSSIYDRVLAVDVVARFLDTAMQLQHGKTVTSTDSSDQIMQAIIDPSYRPDRVSFKQFTWIPNEVGRDYDLTVLTFLERTNQPKAWLLRLAEVTRREGLVVIASPTGQWQRSQLEPTLSEKGLVCIDVQEVPYEATTESNIAAITVWAHA